MLLPLIQQITCICLNLPHSIQSCENMYTCMNTGGVIYKSELFNINVLSWNRRSIKKWKVNSFRWFFIMILQKIKFTKYNKILILKTKFVMSLNLNIIKINYVPKKVNLFTYVHMYVLYFMFSYLLFLFSTVSWSQRVYFFYRSSNSRRCIVDAYSTVTDDYGCYRRCSNSSYNNPVGRKWVNYCILTKNISFCRIPSNNMHVYLI